MFIYKLPRPLKLLYVLFHPVSLSTIKHIVKHAKWMGRDDHDVCWCTLCNVKLYGDAEAPIDQLMATLRKDERSL